MASTPIHRTGRRGRLRGAGVVAAALVAASVAGGCGGGSASSPANQSFLSAVYSGAPDLSSQRSPIELERLGHAVCDGFAAGASYEQLADRLSLQAGSGSLSSEDLGAVIVAAADTYCPAYQNRV